MIRTRAVLAVAVLMLSGSAFADTILYTVENLGGNRWQYNYTVDNTGTNALEEFAIFFDLGAGDAVVYDNLAVADTADGWFADVFQPDTSIPDGGIVESFLDTGLFPILPGETLSGWSVSFDYLLAGTPGDQFFEFYDFNFDVISEGFTQRAAATVPEPATTGLLVIGLLLFAMMRRRQPARAIRAN